MAEYNGPGEYTVRVYFSGSTTVTVTAISRDDAYRKAELEADDIDCDFDVEADDIVRVQPIVGENMSTDWRDQLTGVEEAAWALTGRIPPEAIQRLSELAALELEAAHG